jgi:hypothetical protein
MLAEIILTLMCGFPEDTPQYLLVELNENRAAHCSWYSPLLKLN